MSTALVNSVLLSIAVLALTACSLVCPPEIPPEESNLLADLAALKSWAESGATNAKDDFSSDLQSLREARTRYQNAKRIADGLVSRIRTGIMTGNREETLRDLQRRETELTQAVEELRDMVDPVEDRQPMSGSIIEFLLPSIFGALVDLARLSEEVRKQRLAEINERIDDAVWTSWNDL